MGLNISNTKKLILRGIGIFIAILLVGAIVRVTVWEHNYYSRMEGSERHIVPNTNASGDPITPPEELEEEIPSPQTVREHIVPADHPRYITIPKLGIRNARILSVSVDPATNKLGVPKNIHDVGWFHESSKPGEGGTLLMDGHNGGTSMAGVFAKLPRLGKGDSIIIERGDGAIFEYEVYELPIMEVDQASAHMAVMQQSPISGVESLSIISCADSWSDRRQTFSKRIMLRATLKQQEGSE